MVGQNCLLFTHDKIHLAMQECVKETSFLFGGWKETWRKEEEERWTKRSETRRKQRANIWGRKKKGGERDKRCYHMRLTLKKPCSSLRKMNRVWLVSRERDKKGNKTDKKGVMKKRKTRAAKIGWGKGRSHVWDVECFKESALTCFEGKINERRRQESQHKRRKRKEMKTERETERAREEEGKR